MNSFFRVGHYQKPEFPDYLNLDRIESFYPHGKCEIVFNAPAVFNMERSQWIATYPNQNERDEELAIIYGKVNVFNT